MKVTLIKVEKLNTYEDTLITKMQYLFLSMTENMAQILKWEWEEQVFIVLFINLVKI